MINGFVGPSRRNAAIAILVVAMIALHLITRYFVASTDKIAGYFVYDLFLIVAIGFGGVPLIAELLRKAFRREFGADLLF